MFIISVILEYLKDPKVVMQIANDVIEYYKDRTGEKQIKSLETQIGITQKQIEDTTQAFIEAVAMKSEIMKKSCTKKIEELTILIEDLTEQKHQITFENGIQATTKDIVSFVNDFITPQSMESDIEYQKRLYDNLVNAVYVYDDKIVVWFNVKGGKEKITTTKEQTDIALNNKENKTGARTVLTSSAPAVVGGQGWIRTSVALQRQFYRLLVLTTHTPTRMILLL